MIEAAGLTPQDVLHILAEVVLNHGRVAELDPAAYRRALVDLPGSPLCRTRWPRRGFSPRVAAKAYGNTDIGAEAMSPKSRGRKKVFLLDGVFS